ncbi:MAG: PASTA domain-containing protein [Melioribacteraceae bacterium]|nr:PASTA domain-containing protein [Melioribacteraceae bacterium]
MKKIIKKLLIFSSVIIILIVSSLLLLENVIMPSVVYSPEVKIPNLVGKDKYEAIAILKSVNLTPIELGPRYDERYEADQVIYQKPNAGTMVKEYRRVYIHISGGEPLVMMPQLVNRTLRDAELTIKRLGLNIRSTKDIRSELPAGVIVEQEYPDGYKLEKGDSVSLKISVGPQIGMIRVPNLIAKSEKEAERTLRRNNLKIGEKTYITSPTLLPNTVISQYPSQDFLLNIGDSVDVVIAKSK